MLTGGAVLGLSALLDRRGAPTAPEMPTARERAPGRPLPRLTALVDHPVTRTGVRLAVLAALALLLATAALGTDRSSRNPAPRLAYDVFWPSLLLASALLGRVWRAANPLRLIASGLERLAGDDTGRGTRPLPPNLGLRPATAAAALWVWAELALPDRPSIVAAVACVLALITLAGAGIYGRAFIAHADPFEAASGLFARLAPVGRNAQRTLVLRSPWQSLVRRPLPPGAHALLAVLLGAHVFDGLNETAGWQRIQVGASEAARLGLDSVLLAGCCALVAGAIAVGQGRDRALLGAFVPLLAGYAFAHYFPVLPIEAQVVLAQISDPLGTGADVFGTGDVEVSVRFLPGPVAAVMLLVGLLAAHLAAVVLGGDTVAARHRRREATALQVGFRAVVVTSALAAVALRFVQ